MGRGVALTLVSSAMFLLMISDGTPGGTFWSMLSLTCLGHSSLVASPAALLLTIFAARGYPNRPGRTVGFGALAVIRAQRSARQSDEQPSQTEQLQCKPHESNLTPQAG